MLSDDDKDGYYLALDSLDEFDENRPFCQQKVVKVPSLEEASNATRRFIEENGLGKRTFNGGQIFKEGAYVATISFNGRGFLPIPIGSTTLIPINELP